MFKVENSFIIDKSKSFNNSNRIIYILQMLIIMQITNVL